MFRAAKALQRGTTNLARPRVPPTQLSSSSFLAGLDDRSDNQTSAPPTRSHYIRTDQLLRSVYRPTQYSTCFGGSNTTTTRRGFASSSAAGAGSDDNPSTDVDSTLERLFRENEVVQGGDATAAAQPWVPDDSVIQAVASGSGGMEFVPTWYNPADWCIRTILQIQELSGLEMGMAIGGTTLLLRVLLFPVVASGQKSASRMAHLSPELKHLQTKYENIRNKPTMEQRHKMGEEVNALFKRYETNPIKSMTAPFIQLPFMMGMFFGIKKMPDYFPQEFATGGMYWFTDLSVPDPTYILPGICMLTFAATVELTKEQMMASSPESGAKMVGFMRALSLVMGGVCTTFDAGLVLYFTITNTFTVGQVAILKMPAVKKYFGIWDPPKPVPGGPNQGGETLIQAGKKLMDRAQGKIVDEDAKIRHHNQTIETQKKMNELSKKRRERRRKAIKKRGQ